MRNIERIVRINEQFVFIVVAVVGGGVVRVAAAAAGNGDGEKAIGGGGGTTRGGGHVNVATHLSLFLPSQITIQFQRMQARRGPD